MKNIFKIFIAGTLIFSFSACKKFLDVNRDPNNSNSATPELVLPQAIVTSAAAMPAYDNFGAWTGGYKANAGGFGGWGIVWTYNFTTSDYTNIWTSTYASINQLNFVINNSTPDGPLKYYNAMARVMKGFMYHKLVDQYGDVPYSEAGKGNQNLTPKYDKYSDVYKGVYADLDAAIAIFNAAPGNAIAVTPGQDPLFGGSANGLVKWKKFANTIKLKMLIRAQKATELANWVTTAASSLPTASTDYISDDVIVQPGYSASNNAQFNPKWLAFAYDENGTALSLGSQHIPTPWILSFYNGQKLADNIRGAAVYAFYGTNITTTIDGYSVTYVQPGTNQLGYDTSPTIRARSGSNWLSGIGRAIRPTNATANTATDMGGVLKGATMGTVLMLASESYFLQAEATLTGVNLLPSLAGTTKTLYENGITASYNYLYKNAGNTYFNTTPAATLKNNYITANAAKAVVNFDLAVTPEQQLEAIITQKYIAVNFINSDEGFNEYRRTGYPRINNGSLIPTESFASIKSTAPTADKLPTRILYPAVEFQVNTQNVPKGISPFTTKMFYAK